MSSINSVGGFDSAQVLRQVLQGRNHEGGAVGGRQHAGDRRAAFESALKSLGIGDDDIKNIQKEIADKLKEARQDSGGFSSPQDKHQQVQGIIDGVLQSHGIDVDAFRQALGHGAPEPTDIQQTHADPSNGLNLTA